MRDKRFDIRLKESEYMGWQSVAKVSGITVAELVRKGVEEWIENNYLPKQCGHSLEARLDKLEEQVENLEENYIDLHNTFGNIFNMLKDYDRDEGDND